MKTLAILTLAAALPFTIPTTPAPAEPPATVADDEAPRPARGPMLGGLVDRLGDGLRGRIAAGLDELDVSDAQRETLGAIVRQHADRLRATREAEGDARTALLDASATRPTDVGAIHVASQALASAMADARIATGTLRDELRAVLTPEQVAQLDAKRAGARERLGELRGLVRERLTERFAERRGR